MKTRYLLTVLAIFSFTTQIQCLPDIFYQHYYINISHAQLIFGNTQGETMQTASGLSIILLQISYHIHVSIKHCKISDNKADQYGANMLFYGNQCTASSVEIFHTLSANGKSYNGAGLLFLWDGFTSKCAYKWYTILAIENSEFIGNEADEGSALEVILALEEGRYYYNESGDYPVYCLFYCDFDGPTVSIKNSTISNNNVISKDNQTSAGVLSLKSAGLAILENVTFTHNTHFLNTSNPNPPTQEHLPAILNLQSIDPKLLIELMCINCNFSYNNGNSFVADTVGSRAMSIRFMGATTFHTNFADRGPQAKFSFSHIIFYDTISFTGNNQGAIDVFISKLEFVSVNALFEDNKGVEGVAINSFSTDIVFEGQASFVANNASFWGGAINFLGGTILIKGNMTFENNYAEYGGAIAVHSNGILYLQPHTHMKFINNTAVLYGGAFHVESSATHLNPRCFLQVDDIAGLGQKFDALDVKVTFSYNTAAIAGSALFGGELDFDSKVSLQDQTFSLSMCFTLRVLTQIYQ